MKGLCNRRSGTAGLLAVLSVLSLPPAALGAGRRHLSQAQAEYAITAYEHHYWTVFTKGPIPIRVSQCRRHSATDISCLARTIVEQFWAFSRDWVTLSPHGSIVVSPGGLQMLAFRSPAEALARASG